MSQAADGVLLKFQQVLISLMHLAVVVYEKSRRIGASWTSACAAVMRSAARREAGGMDTLYIGYNLDMAREFIDDAAFWARHLHGLAVAVKEFVFTDKNDKEGDKDIQAFRIRFASGYEIVALSSRPRSLRGKQGFVIIDEAAFHDDLPGLIKAALAMLIWGGKVWIVSTHFGDDNAFNELVQDIREGRSKFKLLRTTFEDAIEQGLYRRVCFKLGKEWTQEGEDVWVQEIRDYYGEDAEEELDCIPSKGTGVYLTRAMIEACMDSSLEVVRLKCEDDFAQRPDEERRAWVESWLENEMAPRLEKLDPNLRTSFGEDFGRSGDLTVIAPGQEQADLSIVVPFILELRNVPFKEQEQILFYIVHRLPRFNAGALDARGNGQFLAERAMQEFGLEKIEQVMLSNPWYLANMPRMKARFEDGTIKIPKHSDPLHDLRSIKTQKGIPKVPDDARSKGTDGGQRHADAAVAFCLLVYAAALDVVTGGIIIPDYDPMPVG